MSCTKTKYNSYFRRKVLKASREQFTKIDFFAKADIKTFVRKTYIFSAIIKTFRNIPYRKLSCYSCVDYPLLFKKQLLSQYICEDCGQPLPEAKSPQDSEQNCNSAFQFEKDSILFTSNLPVNLSVSAMFTSVN